MTISWTASASRNLTALAINGSTVWTGSIASGAARVALTTPISIPVFSIIKNNTFTFSGTASVILTLDATFETSTGAIFYGRLDPANEPTYPGITPVYPAANKVSKWSMNENAGTSVADSFGANTGTYTSAVWAAGKFSSGLQFGGSNNRLTVADAGTLDLTNAATVGAWIYPTTLRASDGIAHKGIATGAADEAYSLTLGATNSSAIRFYFRNSAGTTFSVESAAATIATNNWYFVVGTWSTAAAGGNVSVYINGELANTTAVAAIQNARNSATALLVGSKFSSGANANANLTFRGRIDEAFIYNRAMTANEIKALYLGVAEAGATIPTIIKSTGKFVEGGGTIKMRQTMLATFEVTGGVMNITNYDEILQHLLP